MDIEQTMDSLQEVLDQLQAIGDEHVSDAGIQRRVAKAALAGAAGMKRLSLMLFYRDEKEVETNGNSTVS